MGPHVRKDSAGNGHLSEDIGFKLSLGFFVAVSDRIQNQSRLLGGIFDALPDLFHSSFKDIARIVDQDVDGPESLESFGDGFSDFFIAGRNIQR